MELKPNKKSQVGAKKKLEQMLNDMEKLKTLKRVPKANEDLNPHKTPRLFLLLLDIPKLDYKVSKVKIQHP